MKKIKNLFKELFWLLFIIIDAIIKALALITICIIVIWGILEFIEFLIK